MTKMDFSSPLPIDAALPEAHRGVARRAMSAVLVAPPGAGKTTRVPLVLGGEPWAQDGDKVRRILVLEPRRLAARAAAERMAETLGETRRRDGRPAGTFRLEDLAREPESRSSPKAFSPG